MLKLKREVLPEVVTEVGCHILGDERCISNIQMLFCLEAFARCADSLSTSLCSNSTSYSAQFVSGHIHGMKYKSQEMFI